MIKIIVELWPNGFEEGKKVIAEGTISNDLTGTSEEGNYRYFLTAHGGKAKLGGRVCGYKRQKHSVWYLVNMVLANAYRRK